LTLKVGKKWLMKFTQIYKILGTFVFLLFQ
jgi:hypothetical protein